LGACRRFIWKGVEYSEFRRTHAHAEPRDGSRLFFDDGLAVLQKRLDLRFLAGLGFLGDEKRKLGLLLIPLDRASEGAGHAALAERFVPPATGVRRQRIRVEVSASQAHQVAHAKARPHDDCQFQGRLFRPVRECAAELTSI
jgi:hypothetical protein